MTKHKKPSERGAELIEFALVLPLLLLVVLGIVDFGFLFQRLEVVTNAAREGARIAVLPGYVEADVKLRVRDFMDNGGVATTSTNPAISLTDDPIALTGGKSITGKRVTVVYSHNYMFLSGFANLFGGSFSSIPLTGLATMRPEAGSP